MPISFTLIGAFGGVYKALNYNFSATKAMMRDTRNASDANKVVGLTMGLASDLTIFAFRLSVGLLGGSFVGLSTGLFTKFLIKRKYYK